jgi:Amt family ammonium transporter
VSIGSAALIGLLASIVCFIGVAVIKPAFNYDDSLDVFGVHGIGGILGALAVGLFATTSINAAGANGLFYGGMKQLLIQLGAVAVTSVYTFIVTFIIYKLVDVFFGARVHENDELTGLDLSQHHERAYTILE